MGVSVVITGEVVVGIGTLVGVGNDHPETPIQ